MNVTSDILMHMTHDPYELAIITGRAWVPLQYKPLQPNAYNPYDVKYLLMNVTIVIS